MQQFSWKNNASTKIMGLISVLFCGFIYWLMKLGGRDILFGEHFPPIAFYLICIAVLIGFFQLVLSLMRSGKLDILDVLLLIFVIVCTGFPFWIILLLCFS